MERNSLEQDLIQVFNNLIINGLNNNNIQDVERILIALIDNSCMSIFRKNIVCNFLFFLKSSSYSSFLVEHLIEEVEKKSLRIYYMDISSKKRNSNSISENKTFSSSKKTTVLDVFNDSPLSQIFENDKK